MPYSSLPLENIVGIVKTDQNKVGAVRISGCNVVG